MGRPPEPAPQNTHTRLVGLVISIIVVVIIIIIIIIKLNYGAYGDGFCVAPAFMAGNGIGYARKAGDEPPRYKISYTQHSLAHLCSRVKGHGHRVPTPVSPELGNHG